MKTKILIPVILSLFAIISSCSDDEIPQVNSTPKFLAQEFTVSEDIPSNQEIGKLQATDLDGDSVTFSIFLNDNDLFQVSADGSLSLVDGKQLDFETSTQHTITVTASDGDRQTDSKVTIIVENIIDTMAEEPASFVTQWRTANENETITIGTHPAYEYAYTIDWGDGTVEEDQTQQNPSHKYENSGIYQVVIQGVFPAFVMDNSDNFSKEALVSIDKWGTMKWETMERAFMGCINMLYEASDVPDLSFVENMDFMFANAKKFDADLNNWNVETITSMAGTFANALKFEGDISQWDVNKVTDMSYMFNNAPVFNADLSDWKVASVKLMNFMFSGASIFNADIGGWTVENVTDMSAMFANANAFDQDLSGWKVENVQNMFGMFANATSFDQNLGNWKIVGVTNLENMLDGSGLSQASYESTLVGWSDYADDLIDTLNGLTLGAEVMSYCSEDAQLAHDNLTIAHGWAIIGDSQQCN